VTLNENYFFSNTSKDYGGAIHLDAVQTAELTGNRIRNSHAYNHRITEMAARGGDGGAIYSRISKTVTLKIAAWEMAPGCGYLERLIVF
jgi:hypothetical protein